LIAEDESPEEANSARILTVKIDDVEPLTSSGVFLLNFYGSKI
jgi:hypothetical protein